MVLIVDSGSTKSDWVLMNNGEQHSFSTMGLNPYFHDEDTVYNAVHGNTGLNEASLKVERLYFYGAGCSAPHLNDVIRRGLKRLFINAEISVDHDLTACAYATYQGEPSISCIIGTGSNSCYFDGKNVSEVVPALGYILGDEGSGSYFGKKLLSNYLYHRLPEDISDVLKNELGLTKDLIVERVYMTPNANVYLASFMPFITRFAEHPYIQEMVYEGFRHFIDIHVCCYPNYREVKSHFVGSIAQIFEKQLLAACESLDVQIGSIIRKPIDGLVSYHENHLKLQKS
jgi:N-acetylglucosamine kinase-like BadF-type ATPase